MASKNPLDIRETGPQGFKQLQQANNQNLTGISPTVQEMIQNIQKQNAPISQYDARAHAEQLVSSSLSNTSTPWGESVWDEESASEEQFQHLGTVRAENQPWYVQLGNGLAKGVVLTGTTLLDGTIGLLTGSLTAASEGRWSGLWDNEFSRAMQSITEWSEEVMPNYYTEAEQNDPWYKHIGSANFIGDKFIKNLGFTIGAFYSGNIGAGILRGAGALATRAALGMSKSISTAKKISKASKMVSSVIGSGLSAVNEGRIEALNNSKDWYETQKMKIDDEYQQRISAIEQEYEETGDEVSYRMKLQKEHEAYESTLAKVDEDRLKMGNVDLLMNIPVLMFSNMIQFGKMYANGFRTGKRANNILGNLRKIYRPGTTRTKGVVKAFLNPLSEGTEEISQAAASRISGDYYETDVHNFYKEKTDRKAEKETLDWIKAAARGINETVNEGSSWEEFFIGTLTGALGMPRFRSMRNSQGKIQSPIVLQGGILGELKENRQQIAREQRIADYLNNRVQSPDYIKQYRGMIRHFAEQGKMDESALDDDEFEFKNSEFRQFLSDIDMFDSAGKLGDLIALINHAHGTNIEELESIYKNTTLLVTKEEQQKAMADRIQELDKLLEERRKAGKLTPEIEKEIVEERSAVSQAIDDPTLKDSYVGSFSDERGNPMYVTEEGKKKMIDKLTQTKDNMLKQIDEYVKIKIELQERLPESVSDDQLEELIYLKAQINNWEERGEEMSSSIKEVLKETITTLQTRARASKLAGDEKAEKTHNKNVEYLESLMTLTPKQLMQILTRPESKNTVEAIQGILYEFGQDTVGTMSKNQTLKMLNDMIKIGKSKDIFQKRLDRYIADPAIQALEHQAIQEQQALAENIRANISKLDQLSNSSTSEIVRGIEEGELEIDDDLMSLLEEEEEQKTKSKVDAAKDIIETDKKAKQDLQEMVDAGEISQEEAADVLALLEASKAQAESSEELLDTELEAFADSSVLDGSVEQELLSQMLADNEIDEDTLHKEYQELMSQRMDKGKNIVKRLGQKQLERKAAVADIPSAPSSTLPSEASSTTGHDPAERVSPVNAPVPQAPQSKVSEDNQVFTDKVLAQSGLTREQHPGTAKALDTIWGYIDRCIAQGLDNKGVLDVIADTQTYKNLENARWPIKDLVKRVLELKRKGDMETKPQEKRAAKPVTDVTPDTSASHEDSIDAENKRDNMSYLSPAYIDESKAEGTTTSMGKTDGVYDYWRPQTPEFPFRRKRGDNTPFWESAESPARERYRAVYEYLKKQGVFERIKNDKVKKGDVVHFGISKELTEALGKPVILILNSNNEVIGDLPMPEDNNFNSYAGLSQLYDEATKWYQDNKDTLHTDNNDIAVIPGYKSNVAKNMIGKPQYTAQEERHTLNEINTVTASDGTQKAVPFKLGIAVANAGSSRIRIMADPGRSQSQGASPMERTIVSPLRAVKGQPFLLMPTSSSNRAFVPVPIMMPTFTMSDPKVANSALGRIIQAKIQELATISDNQDKLQQWSDELRELLAFKEVYVGYTATKLGLRGKTQKFTVKVKNAQDSKWTTLFSGEKEEAPAEVVKKLSEIGAMFQISRKYINDTYNGRSYNELIGELAETNLPVGATHTVSDWFTIDPVVDKKQRKAHSPKSTKVNPTQTNGSVVRFKDSKGNSYYMTRSHRLYKENPNGNDMELLGDKYNYLRAHAYGGLIGESYTRPYDTPWGYYNPQTGKFQQKDKPDAIPVISGREGAQLRESSGKITFNEKDHTYTVNGKLADMSVTQWVHRNDPPIEEEAEGILGYLEISSRLGTEVDRMCREFFLGNIYKSPLLTDKQNAAVLEEIKKLKAGLDTKFGRGKWKAITNENMLRVAGTIQTLEGVKTIAGTIDMLIQDDKGYFHIIDFKTKRSQNSNFGIIGSTKEDYDTQVSLYAALLEQSNPLFKGRIGKSYLAIFNPFYQTPKGARSNETGSITYTEKKGQIMATDSTGKSINLNEQEGFNPSTYNRLQEVDYSKSLPAIGAIKDTAESTAQAPAGQSAQTRKAAVDKPSPSTEEIEQNKQKTWNQTEESFTELLNFNHTSNGVSSRVNDNSWWTKVGDPRTEKRPAQGEAIWSEKNGYTYLQVGTGGRGDVKAVWFKHPVPESKKKAIEELFKSSTEVTDELQNKILEILKDKKSSERQETQPQEGIDLKAQIDAGFDDFVDAIGRTLIAATENPGTPFASFEDIIKSQFKEHADEILNNSELKEYLVNKVFELAESLEEEEKKLLKYYAQGINPTILDESSEEEKRKEYQDFIDKNIGDLIGDFLNIAETLDSNPTVQGVLQEALTNEDTKEFASALLNDKELYDYFISKALKKVSDTKDLDSELKGTITDFFKGGKLITKQSRQESMDELKKKGFLTKKERTAALDKLSDDRLAVLSKMSKLKANKFFGKFDVKVKATMSKEDVNDLFDSLINDKPLPRKVEQQVEQDKNWNIDKEVRKLSKILPQLSKEERIRFVETLLRIGESEDPAWAWGKFQNGIITLSKKAARGTAYHEAFHFVSQSLLSSEELESLYQDARKHYGKFKRLELEEELAEDFKKFMQSFEDDGFFKNAFKIIKHFVKTLLGKESFTNKVFFDIRRGAYASRTVHTNKSTLNRTQQYTKEMQDILDNASRDEEGRLLAPNGKPSNLNERQWVQVRTKAFKDWFGDWLNNPSEASKVVDENGEPLVVYHGSKNNVFTIFDASYNDKSKKGFFFTDSEAMAKGYGNIRGFFLNIRDSYDIEGNNSNWNNILIRTTDIAKNKLDAIRLHRNDMRVSLDNKEIDESTYNFWNNRYYKYLDAYNNLGNSLMDKIKKLFIANRLNKFNSEGDFLKSTRNAEAILEYDVDDVNIIFKNIMDYGPVPNVDSIAARSNQESANVYVTTNSNNIKSATSNTGEFSTENDNIYYRKTSETEGKALEDTIKKNIRDMKRESQRFLDNFGITMKEVGEYEGELPLFDALHRVINIRSVDDISEGTGYAIAFMMQHHKEMASLIKYKMNSVPKSVKRSIKSRGDFNALGSLKGMSSENRQNLLKEIGSDIATELRKLYNVEPINVEPKSFLAKLWEIITEFYKALTPQARTKFNVLHNYTKNIANSVKLNDASIVLNTDVKPGSKEKAARVNIERALVLYPYEKGIIDLFNSKGIALAGSASIALSGTLYRPDDNPLHDIDFNAVGYTKEDIATLIKDNFPHNRFIRTIDNAVGKSTVTHLVMDREFDYVESPMVKGVDHLYAKGTDYLIGILIGSELHLKNGVKGKLLDFFIGEDNRPYPNSVHKLNGKSYLIADYRNAMEAKITWVRDKDIWDYNRFVSNDFTPQNSSKKDMKKRIQEARIIWGHPAIGKTTYLETHQDILEWDQEVNPKRDAFIRDQIDPEHKMDIESEEYRNMKQLYMGEEWRTHPEYIEFLTTEWENLKQRADREGKRLFASPAPLLEIGIDDFDLFVNMPEKFFLERNQKRGSSRIGSMSWKQVINDQLVKVDPDKVITTEQYFSDFMEDNYGLDRQNSREIEQYNREKLDYGNLNQEQKDYITARGLTMEEYNSMTPQEREVLFRCMY